MLRASTWACAVMGALSIASCSVVLDWNGYTAGSGAGDPDSGDSSEADAGDGMVGADGDQDVGQDTEPEVGQNPMPNDPAQCM